MDNTEIPPTVLKAFPLLSDAIFVRRLASPVPLVPDTTFDIFMTSSKQFLTLVTTDYADPYDQSRKLKSISGKYEFEFDNIVKSHSENNETIDVLEHDDMDGDFFVTTPYKNYKLYYYLANLKTKSVS